MTDGERTREVPQTEHPVGAEHHRATTKTESHGEGDAPGKAKGMF